MDVRKKWHAIKCKEEIRMRLSARNMELDVWATCKMLCSSSWGPSAHKPKHNCSLTCKDTDDKLGRQTRMTDPDDRPRWQTQMTDPDDRLRRQTQKTDLEDRAEWQTRITDPDDRFRRQIRITDPDDSQKTDPDDRPIRQTHKTDPDDRPRRHSSVAHSGSSCLINVGGGFHRRLRICLFFFPMHKRLNQDRYHFLPYWMWGVTLTTPAVFFLTSFQRTSD